jgi:hypothetical protein
MTVTVTVTVKLWRSTDPLSQYLTRTWGFNSISNLRALAIRTLTSAETVTVTVTVNKGKRMMTQ